MATVAPGSIVALSVAGSTPNFSVMGASGAAVQSAIIAEINASGWLTVVSQNWSVSSLLGIVGSLDILASPFTAALQVQVSPQSGPVASTDVETLVAQAVVDNTGYTPTVSAQVSAGGGAAADPFQWLWNVFPSLQAYGTLAIVALVALVALLIYTVGPNVKIHA